MDEPLAGLARAADLLAGADNPDLLHVADALAAFVTGRANTLDDAFRVPRRRPGERTRATEMAVATRNNLIREAAARYYSGLSAAAQAQQIARDLDRYASTAWPRERVLEHCPARHDGTARELFCQMLSARDRVLSERSVRSVLAMS